MTRMIDTLAGEGLVERHDAPHDRRVKHLTVTPKGEATLEEMFDTADRLRARLLAGLSERQDCRPDRGVRHDGRADGCRAAGRGGGLAPPA